MSSSEDAQVDALIDEVLAECLAEEARKRAEVAVGVVIRVKEDHLYTLSRLRYLTGGREYTITSVGNGGATVVVDADIPGEVAFLGVHSYDIVRKPAAQPSPEGALP